MLKITIHEFLVRGGKIKSGVYCRINDFQGTSIHLEVSEVSANGTTMEGDAMRTLAIASTANPL